jgi:hypothetical protein
MRRVVLKKVSFPFDFIYIIKTDRNTTSADTQIALVSVTKIPMAKIRIKNIAPIL